MVTLRQKLIGTAKLVVCFALASVLVIMTWQTALGPLSQCLEEHDTWNCDAFAENGPTANRFVKVNRILRVGELNDIVTTIHGTYVPIFPDNVDDQTLAETTKAVLRVDPAFSEDQIISAIKKGEIVGFARRPANLQLFGQANEHQLLSELNVSHPAQTWILDASFERMDWTDYRILIIAVAGIGITIFGTASFAQRVLLTTTTSVIGLGIAIGLVIASAQLSALEYQPATWNWVEAPLSYAWFNFGMITALVFSGRTLTVASQNMKPAEEKKDEQDAEKSEDVENAGDQPEPFEVNKNGFIIRDSDGETEFLDSDVVGLGVQVQELEDGDFVRTLRLKIKSGSETDVFVVTDFFSPTEIDPKEAFLKRLADKMAKRFDSEVRQGKNFEGDNWVICRDIMKVGEGKRKEFFDLPALDSVEWMNNELWIWTFADERPAVKLPAHGDNVHVLSRILEHRLTVYARNPRQFQHELGRFFFELEQTDGEGRWPWSQRKSQIMVLEEGLCVDGKEPVRLPFSDVLGFRVADEEHGGLELVFKGTDSPIVMSLDERVPLEIRERVLKSVTKVVSEKLVNLLVTKSKVDVNEQLGISLDGLEIRQSGQSQVLPYKDIQLKRQSGVMQIVAPTAEYTISPSDMNAIAGFHVLETVQKMYGKVAE